MLTNIIWPHLHIHNNLVEKTSSVDHLSIQTQNPILYNQLPNPKWIHNPHSNNSSVPSMHIVQHSLSNQTFLIKLMFCIVVRISCKHCCCQSNVLTRTVISLQMWRSKCHIGVHYRMNESAPWETGRYVCRYWKAIEKSKT